MKVPHQVVGRTRPTSAGMDPLRVQVDPDAFGAGLARGLQGLAAGFEMRAAQVKQREDKTQRFQAMTNFSEFETQVNGHMTELKRTADPTGIGYTAMAEGEYDKMAEKFLAESVAPELREEARYWTSNTKQRILGESMDFQYKAGDAFFRQGVDTEYQRALKGLDANTGGDPTALNEYKASLGEAIDATDLSEIEKAKLKWDTFTGLEGVVYKQAYKKQLATGGGGIRGLIKKEEGFRAEPYWDTTAWRIGYGSDTITRADGSHVKAQPGMTISREDADRDLEYRLTEREGATAQKQVGAQAWGALSGNARAALASVAYNYGSLPASVVNTIKGGGGPQEIARAVASLDANPARRKREAALILNGGDPSPEDALDSSPLFSHLPYEDRVSLQRDGESEVAREQAARAQQEKLRIDTLTNDLYNGINDGLKGQTAIDAARAEGWLTDFDQIKKAQDLYAKRNEDALLRQGTLDKLGAGLTFDPTSEKDKNGLNAVVGKAGLAQIDNMNQEYMANGIIPLVTQAGDIPTDVAGMLQGMVRSNNQSKGLFAFEALAQLQDADPRAFDNRIPDALAADVNFYRQRRTSLPADELFGAINGGRTQAERQGRAILYQEAQDVLKTKTEGVATLSTLVQDVVSGYDGWTSSAEQIGSPAFAKQLMFDYEAAFTDYFVNLDPNTEQAAEWAQKQIARDWAVSVAGGKLMKHPPELSGYPKVLGSYDWIDEQAKELLQLPADGRYELISDDWTASEIVKFKQGLGPPPSYQVVTYDASGTPRLKMFTKVGGAKGEEVFFETGNPARIRFQKSLIHMEQEGNDYELKNINNRLMELDKEMVPYQGLPEEEMPKSLQQEWNGLVRQREAVVGETKRLRPTKEPINPLTMTPLGPVKGKKGDTIMGPLGPQEYK